MLKFRLLMLASFLGGLEAFPQITLFPTDYASIGETVISANDTAAPIGVSIGGVGLQTWNFLGLQNLFTDTVLYLDPQNTPDAGSFTNSNLAAEDSIRMLYESVTPSQVTIDGHVSTDPFGAGITVVVSYNPTQKILEFPMTDGSMFQDTSAFMTTIETSSLGVPVANVDSFRLVHASYITSTVDAYGIVDIPSGSYNSIRQLYTEITIDSTFAYCSDPAGCNVFVAILPFGWSFLPSQLTQLIVGVSNPEWDTVSTYRWWANGFNQAIVELEMDASMTQIVKSRYNIGAPATAIVNSLSNVLCVGDCNGTAEVVGTDGNTPYTYLWDDPNFQTTSLGVGLCAGTYNVRVVNSVQDTTTVSLTIGSPLALSAVFTTTVDSGTANGTATITVSGGSSPYTYVWNVSPVQTQTTATGLSGGSYAVTVTDANGCVYLDSTVVGIASCSISASYAMNSSAICEGETIAFTNTSVGATSYNWMVNNNSFASAVDASYTFDSAGVFEVLLIAIDSNCSDSMIQSVTVNSIPTPTISVLGNAFSSDLTGTAYQWFLNSDTIPGAIAQVYVASQSGFYMVSVTDVNGCSATSANFGYTGLDEVSLISEIYIYPNPSGGEFVLEMAEFRNEAIRLRMGNYLGQVVYTKSLNSTHGQTSIKIEVEHLPPGFYNLEIIVGEYRLVRKILLQ